MIHMAIYMVHPIPGGLDQELQIMLKTGKKAEIRECSPPPCGPRPSLQSNVPQRRQSTLLCLQPLASSIRRTIWGMAHDMGHGSSSNSD